MSQKPTPLTSLEDDSSNPRPFQNGDNPNLRFAKKPKKPIKSVNTPRPPPAEVLYKWVDPLPEPSKVQVTDFDQKIKSDKLATFEIAPNFMEPVTTKTLPILENAFEKSVSEAAMIPYLADTMHAMSDIATGIRLFHSANTEDKIYIKKINQLAKIRTELPLPIVQATAIIGSFDSKLGKFELEHAPIECLKALTNAVRRIRNSAHHPKRTEMPAVTNPANSVFPIQYAIKWAHDRVRKEISVAQERTFQIGEPAMTVRVAPQGEASNAQYAATLNDANDANSYIRRRLRLLDCESLAQMRADQILPHVGLEFAIPIDDLVDACHVIIEHYNSKILPRVKHAFATTALSSSEHGSSAQLAVPDGDKATRTPLPLPDADAALGAVLRPGVNCTFDKGWQTLAPSKSGTLLATLINAATRFE